MYKVPCLGKNIKFGRGDGNIKAVGKNMLLKHSINIVKNILKRRKGKAIASSLTIKAVGKWERGPGEENQDLKQIGMGKQIKL